VLWALSFSIPISTQNFPQGKDDKNVHLLDKNNGNIMIPTLEPASIGESSDSAMITLTLRIWKS